MGTTVNELPVNPYPYGIYDPKDKEHQVRDHRPQCSGEKRGYCLGKKQFLGTLPTDDPEIRRKVFVCEKCLENIEILGRFPRDAKPAYAAKPVDHKLAEKVAEIADDLRKFASPRVAEHQQALAEAQKRLQNAKASLEKAKAEISQLEQETADLRVAQVKAALNGTLAMPEKKAQERFDRLQSLRELAISIEADGIHKAEADLQKALEDLREALWISFMERKSEYQAKVDNMFEQIVSLYDAFPLAACEVAREIAGDTWRAALELNIDHTGVFNRLKMNTMKKFGL
jgi:hypothetical protein